MNPRTLITIDYLIINLKGDFNTICEKTPFIFEPEPFGTKTFSFKYEVLYKGEKIGTLVNTPRSVIIPSDLNQLQFHNHIFYTKTLKEIKSIIHELTDFYNVKFEAINRLDIAYDIDDKKQYYRKLNSSIQSGATILSGRKKAFNQYNELIKGKCINNGFSLGQRSSSKFLRCYNKTLSLQINPKQYILDYYKINNFDVSNVWRFEYQLNSSFFLNVKNFGYDKDFYSKLEKQRHAFENLTWAIFDYSTLIELTKMAQKNFFELRSNTGLSQINKEKEIKFIIDFDLLLKELLILPTLLVKLKTTAVPSTLKRKRLAKAIFREYVLTEQPPEYMIALNLVLKELEPLMPKL